VGLLANASDAGVYIALKKGYFDEERIEIDQVRFQSAAEMVAPLGAGQLDVGGGAPGVGLSNAVTQGIGMRIVADKANQSPGQSSQAILARKDLYDSGQIRGPADLKGRRIAMASTSGIASEAALNRYMEQGGVRAREAELVALSGPEMTPAFANKAIDAASAFEPWVAQLAGADHVVILARESSFWPKHQTAVMLYSEQFAQRRDLAVRFMVAYLRGLRDYNDGVVKQVAAKRAETIDILTEFTPITDRALYERMEIAGLDPNGEVNVESLKEDERYYLAAGLQQTPVDFDKLVDLSFARAAVERLGRY
jgi:NitT/TauT family transport system substrate-binding protein